MFTIAVTGHRPNKLPGGYNADSPGRRKIREATTTFLKTFTPGTLHGISGMALGVDQDFCTVCLALGIPYWAAVPFKGQEASWPPQSQVVYDRLLKAAAEVNYVCSPGYAAWKMQRRNEWQVDRCDLLLAVWNGDKTGGTYNCLAYALRMKKPITVLDPNTLWIGSYEDHAKLRDTKRENSTP